MLPWYGHSQRYGGCAKQSHEFILELIYSWTPDFKNPNTVATVPDHQSSKTSWNCDSFWYLKLLWYRDERLHPNISCILLSLPRKKTLFHWPCLQAHTILQQFPNLKWLSDVSASRTLFLRTDAWAFSPPILQFLCLLDLFSFFFWRTARTHCLLSVRASINTTWSINTWLR